MRGDVGHPLELARPDAEGILLGELDPGQPGRRTAARRSPGRRRARSRKECSRWPRARAKSAAPATSAAATRSAARGGAPPRRSASIAEQHDHADREVEPGGSREGEHDADGQRPRAERASSTRRKRSSRGATVSSISISAAGTRNGPKTFGSLNSPCARGPSTSRSGPGNGDEEREAGDRRRGDRRRDVGEQDEARAANRAHVAGEPEGEDAEVERDREERDRPGRVDQLDRGEQVQRRGTR